MFSLPLVLFQQVSYIYSLHLTFLYVFFLTFSTLVTPLVFSHRYLSFSPGSLPNALCSFAILAVYYSFQLGVPLAFCLLKPLFLFKTMNVCVFPLLLKVFCVTLKWHIVCFNFSSTRTGTQWNSLKVHFLTELGIFSSEQKLTVQWKFWHLSVGSHCPCCLFRHWGSRWQYINTEETSWLYRKWFQYARRSFSGGQRCQVVCCKEPGFLKVNSCWKPTTTSKSEFSI